MNEHAIPSVNGTWTHRLADARFLALQFVSHQHLGTTILGLMSWRWKATAHAATALDSRTLEGDAACIQLSLVIFAGLYRRVRVSLTWIGRR